MLKNITIVDHMHYQFYKLVIKITSIRGLNTVIVQQCVNIVSNA